VTFDLVVEAQTLAGDITTFVAHQGDTVTLNLSADEDSEFHVHGYKLIHNVAAGQVETLTFEADATGRFSLAMHVSDAPDECIGNATDETLHLTATPGLLAGDFVVTAQTENFDLAGGNHWHLFIDGEAHGMIFESTTQIKLAEGEHEVRGVLAMADHCVLPVSDSVVVTGMAMNDGHHSIGDHVADEHRHESERLEIVLGAIEIRPR
jgi:hypothetical protein